jgi:hypothetical protein
MFALNAVVALLVGLVLLIVPETALTQIGTSERYVSTILATRFVGTAMITIALLLWFVSGIAEEAVQKNLGFSLLVTTVVGLVLTIIGSMSAKAVIRTNSWILIVVFALFALGYGFLLFLKPRMKE